MTMSFFKIMTQIGGLCRTDQLLLLLFLEMILSQFLLHID